MAIKMISNYSKKVGLPGYSSHQFSVSLETELVTTADLPAETGRLYQLLQTNVDEQIKTVGFVPPYDYGMEPAETNGASPAPNGLANGPANASALAAAIAAAIASVNGSGNTQAGTSVAPSGNDGNGGNWQRGPAWKCSDKQRDLILKLVEEHQLDKSGVEALAIERFGKGVRLLNKIEASGLIDELLDTHGNGNNSQGNTKRRNGSAYTGGNERRAA